MLRATAPCTFSTSQLPTVAGTWCVLYILTSKCASCHNGVHVFGTSTSKRDPKLKCLLHFDFQMCFAPQQRALFPHLHFQKRSGPGGFCTFDFKMCFAPQRCARFRHLNFQNCSDAVSFSHFLLPIVLRSAKRVQFFHLS